MNVITKKSLNIRILCKLHHKRVGYDMVKIEYSIIDKNIESTKIQGKKYFFNTPIDVMNLGVLNRLLNEFLKKYEKLKLVEFDWFKISDEIMYKEKMIEYIENLLSTN